MIEAPPRLVCCWFDRDPAGQYARMARVLRHTAARHCPGWDVWISQLDPNQGDESSATANTRKLEHWAETVRNAPDGTRVLLMDVDTMILRQLEDGWASGSDISYTIRRKGQHPFPFNAGVLFLRVSPSVRGFVAEWATINARMHRDKREHEQWRKRYGGMNQAALGCLLETAGVERRGLMAAKLPCAEWNCEESAWGEYDAERTRIVHLKSSLRRAVFGFGPNLQPFAPLTRIWRRLEREATEVGA